MTYKDVAVGMRVKYYGLSGTVVRVEPHWVDHGPGHPTTCRVLLEKGLLWPSTKEVAVVIEKLEVTILDRLAAI